VGVIALGFGAGFGLAAYRHLPPMSETGYGVVLACIAVACLAAFLAGRNRGQSQWQMQIQEQEQQQQQGQQQAVQVIINPDTKEGASAVAGAPLVEVRPLDQTSRKELQRSSASDVQISNRSKKGDSHQPVLDPVEQNNTRSGGEPEKTVVGLVEVDPRSIL
jgi:hypothetical protein